MTPYSLAEDVWLAWQFHRPEVDKGLIQAALATLNATVSEEIEVVIAEDVRFDVAVDFPIAQQRNQVHALPLCIDGCEQAGLGAAPRRLDAFAVRDADPERRQPQRNDESEQEGHSLDRRPGHGGDLAAYGVAVFGSPSSSLRARRPFS